MIDPEGVQDLDIFFLLDVIHFILSNLTFKMSFNASKLFPYLYMTHIQ